MPRAIQESVAEGIIVIFEGIYFVMAWLSVAFGLLSTGLMIGLLPISIPVHERILTILVNVGICISAGLFFVFISKCLKRREWRAVWWIVVIHALVFLIVLGSCFYQFKYWLASEPGLKDYLVVTCYAAIILMPPLFFFFPAVRAKFKQV